MRYLRARQFPQTRLDEMGVDFWSWTEEQQCWLLADVVLQLREEGAVRQQLVDMIAAAQKVCTGRREGVLSARRRR